MINTINSTTTQTQNNKSTNTNTSTSATDSFENYLLMSNNDTIEQETSLNIDTSKKPNIKELMDFTGMSFKEASSILYGVIGSNEDTRDWSKILTSNDVLKTAKEETVKMYNTDSEFSLVSNEETNSTQSQMETSPITTTLDIQEGNIKFKQTSQYDEETQTDVVTNSLYLASSNGNLLRNAGQTPSQIVENIDAFGFDINSLKTLSQNDSIPSEIKTLLNDTITYYNSLFNKSTSYSTLDLLSNSLNYVDNSNNE